MKDANTIIEESVSQREEVYSHLRAAADFFHEHEGTFFERGEAIEQLSNRLGIDKSMANEVIGELVSDIVDPVVLSVVGDDKYVGVVDYEEFDGAYGYINYHDIRGPDKRVVCQKCVNEATFDTQVAHATAGDPSGTVASGADYDELLEIVYEHYEDSHDVMPEDVETGATLASGTTIGGNTAYHTGNLVDRGAVTITPSTTNQTIPEGFHNGNGFVEGDEDLIADNIRLGVDIFGVTGNIGAIPDNGDLQAHYDWEQATGTSSVTDQTGNGYDLTGSYSGPSSTINGRAAGLFDGNADQLTTSWPQEPEPITYFAVFRILNVSGSFEYVFDGGSTVSQSFGTNSDPAWIMGPNFLSGGTPDTDVHVLSALFSGGDSVLRIDGEQVVTGDAGSSSFSGLSVGSRSDGVDHSNVAVGEWFGYAQDKSSIFIDAEEYLASKWGVY